MLVGQQSPVSVGRLIFAFALQNQWLISDDLSTSILDTRNAASKSSMPIRNVKWRLVLLFCLFLPVFWGGHDSETLLVDSLSEKFLNSCRVSWKYLAALLSASAIIRLLPTWLLRRCRASQGADERWALTGTLTNWYPSCFWLELRDIAARWATPGVEGKRSDWLMKEQ